MEIKIELDLPAIISAAVSAERIQPIVDKAVSDAIKSAITEATGYRSAFSEALKKQLSEAMPAGLAIDDRAKFQLMLNAAVSDTVQGENAQVIQAALLNAAKAAIPDVPARIQLSQLVADARDGYHKEKHEAFYAHLDMNEYGGGILFLDSNEDLREKYRADIRMSFNKAGEVYALHLDGRDITPKRAPVVVGRFDGLLLAMYVGRTTLELDCDESDVESAASEQYD